MGFQITYDSSAIQPEKVTDRFLWCAQRGFRLAFAGAHSQELVPESAPPTNRRLVCFVKIALESQRLLFGYGWHVSQDVGFYCVLTTCRVFPQSGVALYVRGPRAM